MLLVFFFFALSRYLERSGPARVLPDAGACRAGALPLTDYLEVPVLRGGPRAQITYSWSHPKIIFSIFLQRWYCLPAGPVRPSSAPAGARTYRQVYPAY